MGLDITVSPSTEKQVHELAAKQGVNPEHIVSEAVSGLHRVWFGSAAAPQLGIPFKKMFSDLDAEVVLRQVSPTEFRLEEPFRHLRPPGTGDAVMPGGDPTDLASVPGFLTWLVPPYGRHTLPALLHDELIEKDTPPDDREKYDAIFRDAMGGTGVPFVRRWVMWSAVSAATHVRRSSFWKIAVLSWLLLWGVVGICVVLAALGLFGLPRGLMALALVSPVALSLVWGRRYAFGLISALTLIVLPIPAFGVLAALAVYLLAENMAKPVLFARRATGAEVQVNPVRASQLT